jgi:hypothetical protein
MITGFEVVKANTAPTPLTAENIEVNTQEAEEANPEKLI